MKYLRNCWYMAGWGDELGAGGLLARTFLGEPVVLFRDAEGRAQAVFDRCPHRFAPFSRGHVTDGALTCGYHGLAFDGAGRCVRNPHGPILGNMTVRHYPIHEAYRALWIWMGDPELASPGLLRDLSFVDEAPETAFSKGYLSGRGHYELFVDNILDLSHADFLHPDTLSSGFSDTRGKVKEAGDRVTIRWQFDDVAPSPLSASIPEMTGNSDRVDAWTEVEWSAPAVLTLRSGRTFGDPPQKGGNMTNLHIMTPETERSTHYFFASTRDFAQDDAALNARIADARATIFATEDEPMIGAQQEAMGAAEFWSLRPLLLRTDEGPVRVRRKLAKMIEGERADAEPEKMAADG